MSSRRREYRAFLFIFVAVAWVVAAERSEEWDMIGEQIEQRHSTMGSTDLIQVNVREHNPRFLKLSDRGGAPGDDLKFAAPTVASEECSKEVVHPGDNEKTGDEAVLHCCGTENVVGWHQHLKEKARDLSKHGLTITEPHGHRASSINLKRQMEMNEYMSLVHGCDYCKCPEDIAQASIDLHKQTSPANDDYLDKMLHGGSKLVEEYKHMAHLSHLFRLMANNMSIRGTIDTANHAINLSQEVARITKSYKDRMAVMSLGGHAFLNNLTAFSENPAYQVVRPKVETWETAKDGKGKKPSREVNFRTLRTQVERLGVLSERPDSSFKFYKIIPTELREYNGKLAQVAGWKFLAQDGTNLEGKYHCENAVHEDFAGLTFSFQDHVKLGKIAYLPSPDPSKDMLRFTLFGSQDKKLWKRLFNAVVTPPVASPAAARNTDVWVSIAYNELTPENNPHGAFYDEAMADLSNIMEHFPPISLLSDYKDGPNVRTKYYTDMESLKHKAIDDDAFLKSGYRDMLSTKGYSLGRGLEVEMKEANVIFEHMLGFSKNICGKTGKQTCFQPDQEGVFMAGIQDRHRRFFEWLFSQFKGWFGPSSDSGDENVYAILESMRNLRVGDARIRELEALVTGFQWEKWPHLSPEKKALLSLVPFAVRLRLVVDLLRGESVDIKTIAKLKLWLAHQERVFIHEAIHRNFGEDTSFYNAFSQEDNKAFGVGDYASARLDSSVNTIANIFEHDVDDVNLGRRYRDMVSATKDAAAILAS